MRRDGWDIPWPIAYYLLSRLKNELFSRKSKQEGGAPSQVGHHSLCSRRISKSLPIEVAIVAESMSELHAIGHEVLASIAKSSSHVLTSKYICEPDICADHH